ncbi:MAG: RNA polymerase sigma factor [Planctomycetota bacterium]
MATADVRIRAEEAPAPESDADLALRAREGDRPAFARIYERYAATIHGVLLAVAPRQEARDLVQEVFLLALRAIPRLDDPASVGPWLIRIARNRAHDAHKSKRTVLELPEDHRAPADDAAGPQGATIEEDEEAERALEAVRSLPQAYRETLILRLVEGLSGPEIAARTGMTHGSVRVNLHRGMKLLRERLSQAGGR